MLDVECDSTLPLLWADGPQIQQALLNLLLNAEHALAQRDQPCIAIRLFLGRVTAGPPPLLPNIESHSMPEHGDLAAVIDVADNGPGLPEQIRNRLFEPFVTTRPVGQGTGLGLATTYGIVAQHGGAVLVASVADRGTSFRIVLPYTSHSGPFEIPDARAPSD